MPEFDAVLLAVELALELAVELAVEEAVELALELAVELTVELAVVVAVELTLVVAVVLAVVSEHPLQSRSNRNRGLTPLWKRRSWLLSNTVLLYFNGSGKVASGSPAAALPPK